MVSPLMLETASRSRGTPLPIAVGIGKITKAGSQRITSINTYQNLGIIGLSARMPRRSETDYLNKSIANALRADGMFKYVYSSPYDPEDIDLAITVHLEKCVMNNTMYGTLINHVVCLPLPPFTTFVQIGELVGIVPMEKFVVQWNIVFKLSTPSGKIIKQYRHACDETDMVNLWSQPFGNYMWYDSIFIKNFEAAIDAFSRTFQKDRALILGAIK
jgi:hypothetical protein